MILTTKGLCQPPFPQQEGPRGGGGEESERFGLRGEGMKWRINIIVPV